MVSNNFTMNINIVYKYVNQLSLFVRNILNENNHLYVSRKRKTDIFDAFSFRILNVLNNESEQSIISYINNFKNKNITKKAYVDRDNQINLQFYEYFIKQLSSFNNCGDNNSELFNYNVLSVDGTDIHLNQNFFFAKYNYPKNTNGKCVMPLVTGIYNITKKSPVYLELEKHLNERKSFLEFIKKSNNIKEIKDTDIFIFDRGYYSKDFIDELNKLNIKYIIRSNPTKLLSAGLDDKQFIENGTNDAIIIIEKQDIRILRYKIAGSTYILTTNLINKDKYTLDVLKELYKSRWCIEEYFKFIKRETKFDNMQQKSDNTVHKMRLAIIIFTQIFSLLCNIFTKLFIDSQITFNKTLALKGIIKNQLLLKMIYNKRITREYIFKFCKNYIIPYKIQKNRYYPRKSNNPNKKWYLKSNLGKLHNIKKQEQQKKTDQKIKDRINNQEQTNAHINDQCKIILNYTSKDHT